MLGAAEWEVVERRGEGEVLRGVGGTWRESNEGERDEIICN